MDCSFKYHYDKSIYKFIQIYLKKQIERLYYIRNPLKITTFIHFYTILYNFESLHHLFTALTIPNIQEKSSSLFKTPFWNSKKLYL